METEVITLGLSVEMENDMPQPAVNIGFEKGFMEMTTKEEERKLEELMTEVAKVVANVVKRGVNEEHEKRKEKEFTLDDLIKDLEEFRDFIKEFRNEGLDN